MAALSGPYVGAQQLSLTARPAPLFKPVGPSASIHELMHDVVPASGRTVREPHEPRSIWVEVTAYCACKKCCGSRAQGLTASGKPVTYNGGHFVAADVKLLPYGTQLIIPGYNGGNPVEVIDRGGAIRGSHIDLFMPTHEDAVQWGKRWIKVIIVATPDPSGDRATRMKSEIHS